MKKNKVKFGLTNVYWAKIFQWAVDKDGNATSPAYQTPVRLPGAVSLSIDANGENENFYADNSVYYVINNNSGETTYNNWYNQVYIPTVPAAAKVSAPEKTVVKKSE